MNIYTKWGAVIVFVVVVGFLGYTTGSASKGISTLFTDDYLPKRYMIIEKYPFRVIIYGQFKDNHIYKGVNIREENILKLVDKLGTMPAYKGNFTSELDINLDSSLNTEQIRNTLRKQP